MKRLKKSLVTLSALVLVGYSYFAQPAEADTFRLARKHINPPKIEQKYHLSPKNHCLMYSEDLSSIDEVFENDPKEEPEKDPRKFNVELVLGAYHSPIGIGPDHDVWQYLETGLRLGVDITDNLEGLLELSYAKTVSGWDDHVTGFLLWLRYNFEAEGNWRPYIQAGAGIVNNDIYKNTDQTAIGQKKEYYFKGGVGIFYLLSENTKIGGELMLAHLSNNDEAEDNDGSNPVGISIVYSIDFDFFKK